MNPMTSPNTDFKSEIQNNNNKLIALTIMCHNIIDMNNIDQYVYKMLQNSNSWFVIMKKRLDTITNENRDNVVNPLHAKFRANILDVIAIINANTLQFNDDEI